MKQVVATIPLPIIAIGGVSAGNVTELREVGAHGIAVISAVCCQEDPERAMKALHEALHQGTKGGRHV